MGSMVLDKAGAALLNVILPSTCPVCDRPSDSLILTPICRSCWGGIGPYEGPRCKLCGEPFFSTNTDTCGRCLSEGSPLCGTRFYGIYDNTLKEAVIQLKFSLRRNIAGPLSALMAHFCVPDGIEGIVPVPLSPGSLRERGYPHTLILARSLSRAFYSVSGRRIPVHPNLLVKKKETPPQVGLSRTQRLKNLKGAFKATGGLAGQNLLVLDDVITTGATVKECAKTLLKAGAGRVYAAAPARSANL